MISVPRVVSARREDAAAIAVLLERLAPETLPVPAAEIAASIDRYRVIRLGDRLAAVAALMPLGAGRLELRSLAVDPDCGGRGLGTAMVATLQLEALLAGCRLRCVTLNPEFFERLGFECIPMEWVPPKPAREEHPVERPRFALEWSAVRGGQAHVA